MSAKITNIFPEPVEIIYQTSFQENLIKVLSN